MTLSRRTIIAAVTVCCLAVVAGVAAEHALANGGTVYCDGCTLSSDGVPAQSAVFKDFYYNDMSTSTAADLQIYNYYSGTATCRYHADDSVKVWTGFPTYGRYGYSCVPSTVYSSARCHLLNNTGPTQAGCFAYYETTG